MAGAVLDLPLFPLRNMVLFPGIHLPLHIFEQRYRDLIGSCLTGDLPFGIVLIAEGEEVGAPAKPKEVGTLVKITQSERLDDGRFNIIVLGLERFRVLTHLQEEPYRVARVQLWPDAPGSPETLEEQAATVANLLDTYVERLRERLRATNRDIEPITPPEAPEELATFVAATLPIDTEEKQALLEMADAGERLDREAEILRRELLFVGRFGAMSVEDRQRLQQRAQSWN